MVFELVDEVYDFVVNVVVGNGFDDYGEYVDFDVEFLCDELVVVVVVRFLVKFRYVGVEVVDVHFFGLMEGEESEEFVGD